MFIFQVYLDSFQIYALLYGRPVCTFPIKAKKGVFSRSYLSIFFIEQIDIKQNFLLDRWLSKYNDSEK